MRLVRLLPMWRRDQRDPGCVRDLGAPACAVPTNSLLTPHRDTKGTQVRSPTGSGYTATETLFAQQRSGAAGMRMRRGAALAVVAGGGAVTTMLVGLVTNAVSVQSHWPSWLGWLQKHPWLSFVMLGVIAAALAAVLTVLDDRCHSRKVPEPVLRPDDGSGPPGAALVLRSLPRDTSAFTNRSAELESLVQSVHAAQETGEGLPVHVIDGMSGVGKTAFAVHAGHVLSERFPDGQLFVNLNGHTPGRSPVQATEALASLLAAAAACQRSRFPSVTTSARSPRLGPPCGVVGSQGRRRCSFSTTRAATGSWSLCSPAGAIAWYW
ncbi:hypothetical protein ACQ4WX_22155 [Streptomyces lasalocidi]